jgi:putative FmdB family regulatory protein
MPTYEYRCKGCGANLEVVQSFDEPSLTVCPQCSGPLRKVFGSIGITFKGEGFYKNDHGKNGKRASSSNGSESGPSSSETSSEKSSEKSSETTSSGGDHGHAHSHGDHSHTHSHASSSSSTSAPGD